MSCAQVASTRQAFKSSGEPAQAGQEGRGGVLTRSVNDLVIGKHRRVQGEASFLFPSSEAKCGTVGAVRVRACNAWK